jgi:hypothetical protein
MMVLLTTTWFLFGAVIYFGPDLAWGPTWKEGRSNRSACVKPAWAGRKPDGTHPYDPKMAGPMSPGSNGGRYPDGSPINDFLGIPEELGSPGYLGAGKGRLVFGCVLEDSCLLNDFDTRGRLEARDGFGVEGFHMARYAARIQAYGSRILVANHQEQLRTCPEALLWPTAGIPATPADVKAVVIVDGDAVSITWKDVADNEIGFRVERRIQTGRWQTIAYRPPRIEGAAENPQAWVDFLAPPGQPLCYRVAAINAQCQGEASKATEPITLRQGAGR